MKKAKYNITTINGNEEVSGLISNNFGIHKSSDEEYVITHLKTGLSIYYFDYFKQAKKCVYHLEQTAFPIPWENVTKENAGQNDEMAWEIIKTYKHK